VGVVGAAVFVVAVVVVEVEVVEVDLVPVQISAVFEVVVVLCQIHFVCLVNFALHYTF